MEIPPDQIDKAYLHFGAGFLISQIICHLFYKLDVGKGREPLTYEEHKRIKKWSNIGGLAGVTLAGIIVEAVQSDLKYESFVSLASLVDVLTTASGSLLLPIQDYFTQPAYKIGHAINSKYFDFKLRLGVLRPRDF